VGAESAACIIPTRVFANISRLLVDGVAGADVLTIAPSAALFSPDMAALITSALRLATTLAGQLIVDFAGGVVSGPLNNAVNAFLARAAPSGAKECPPAAQIPSPEDTPLASRQLVNWGNSSIVAALSKLANAEQLNALAAALFPGPPGRGAMIANGTVVSINYTDHFHGGVPATLVIADLEVHGASRQSARSLSLSLSLQTSLVFPSPLSPPHLVVLCAASIAKASPPPSLLLLFTQD
jgi:hypothetical protein